VTAEGLFLLTSYHLSFQKKGDLENQLVMARSALSQHHDAQQLQRSGMNIMRINAKKKMGGVAMLHLDAKSKYGFPRFWQDLRSTPNDKYWYHALGNFLFLFFLLSLFLSEAAVFIVFLLLFALFLFCLFASRVHDMINDTSLTFLLEESAGTQDGDLIASTLWLYCNQFIDRHIKELIIVMDNCRCFFFYSFFLLLQLGRQCEPSFSSSSSSSSVNKNYKMLAFCQLLVDLDLFDQVTLYFLFENHAKGSFICLVSFVCFVCFVHLAFLLALHIRPL